MARIAGDSGPPNTKVSLSRILAFSLPSLPLAALGLPLVVQLPHHYESYVGVDIGIVGIMFMLARCLDIGVDIGIGLAMDKTRTPIGRFSPWLLASAPVIIVGTWFLFMAKPGAGAAYLAISLFLTYVGFSMGSLSQMSLGATLSDNYHERSRVFAFWQAGNVVGMLLVLMIPVFASNFSKEAGSGVHGMGWFIILLVPISVLVAAKFAKEASPKAEPKSTTLPAILGLFKSKAVRSLLIADLILMTSSGVTGGLFLFYFAAIKGYSEMESSALLLVYFVAGLLGASIWTFIARRHGKHVSLIVACLYAALTQPLLIFLPKDNFVVAAVSMAGAGIVYTSAAYLLRAMMADVGDEDLLTSGQDRTGLLYALVTLTGKGGYALAVGVTFMGLGMIGFDSKLGSGNSAEALNGLSIFFIGLPSVLSILGAFILKGYPINAQRTRELQEEIALKREQGLI